MIGGAVTFVNPEPLAPFADVIAAGEGEVLIPALMSRDPRRRRIATTCCARLAPERGFYIPSFYDVRYDDGRDDRRRSSRSPAPALRRS